MPLPHSSMRRTCNAIGYVSFCSTLSVHEQMHEFEHDAHASLTNFEVPICLRCREGEGSTSVDLMPAFQQFNRSVETFDGFEYVEREFSQLAQKRVRSRIDELHKLKIDAKSVRMNSFQQNYGVFISTAQGLAMIESHLNPLKSKLDEMEDVRKRLSSGSATFADLFQHNEGIYHIQCH